MPHLPTTNFCRGLMTSSIIPPPESMNGNNASSISLLELEELAEHYTRLLRLALYSNYYYAIKDQLVRNSAAIIEALQNLLATRTANNKTALSKTTETLRNARETLSKAKETHGIAYYSDEDNNEHFTPKDKFPRTTHIYLDIDKKIKAEWVETITDKAGNKQLISESTVPPNLDDDQLMKWARATILSFLAAAPSGTNQINFDDGFSEKQLSALTSYCRYIGCYYHLGEMQITRLHIDKMQAGLSEELTKKIKDNEKLSPEEQQEIVKKIKGDEFNAFRKTWETKSIDPFDWQKWSNTQKNHHDFAPIMGKEKSRILLEKIAKQQTLTPAEWSNATPLSPRAQSSQHALPGSKEDSSTPLTPRSRPRSSSSNSFFSSRAKANEQQEGKQRLAAPLAILTEGSEETSGHEKQNKDQDLPKKPFAQLEDEDNTSGDENNTSEEEATNEEDTAVEENSNEEEDTALNTHRK